MGNSFCCISLRSKEQLQYEIKVDIFNEKEIKDNEFYGKKTTMNISPKSNEVNDFINPLPTIVVIRPKKNKIL